MLASSVALLICSKGEAVLGITQPQIRKSPLVVINFLPLILSILMNCSTILLITYKFWYVNEWLFSMHLWSCSTTMVGLTAELSNLFKGSPVLYMRYVLCSNLGPLIYFFRSVVFYSWFFKYSKLRPNYSVDILFYFAATRPSITSRDLVRELHNHCIFSPVLSFHSCKSYDNKSEATKRNTTFSQCTQPS